MHKQLAAGILYKAVMDWKKYCTINGKRSKNIISSWPSGGSKVPDIARACHSSLNMDYESPRDELLAFFKGEWCVFLMDGLDIDYKAAMDEIGVMLDA